MLSLVRCCRVHRAVRTPPRAVAVRPVRTFLHSRLRENDPEIFDIIEHEKARQRGSIVLIPSEVCQLQLTQQ